MPIENYRLVTIDLAVPRRPQIGYFQRCAKPDPQRPCLCLFETRRSFSTRGSSMFVGRSSSGFAVSSLEKRPADARGLVPPKNLCALLMIGMVLAIPVNALDPQKLISQFTHTSWTAKDAVPGPVRAIVQTPDGHLCLGPTPGFYPFPGLHFLPLTPSFCTHIL